MVAPPPVSVTGFPVHTVLLDAFAVTGGEVVTVTVTEAVFVQPLLVPVTV